VGIDELREEEEKQLGQQHAVCEVSGEGFGGPGEGEGADPLEQLAGLGFSQDHELIGFNYNINKMVKGNNMLNNVHRRKHWQRNVRAYLNQATRKHRRLLHRRDRSKRLGVRPVDRLKPAVHCQTIRYNRRIRLGRGFTLQELKAAGISRHFAQSIGISVDHRRKNRCQESIDTNVARLKNYLGKIVIGSAQSTKKGKGPTGGLPDTPAAALLAAKTVREPVFNQLPPRFTRVLPEAITKDMKKPLFRSEGKRNKFEKVAKKATEGKKKK
jgi:large subunit ribosomal protein L13e